MSLRLLFLIACVLGGCASLAGPDLPTCDGKSRRPANPYGSILSPAPVPPVTSTAPAVIDAATPASGGCA